MFLMLRELLSRRLSFHFEKSISCQLILGKSAYGVADGLSIDVWIGMPPLKNYRYPWTIDDSSSAGDKIMELLVDLLEKGSIPKRDP